MVIEAKAKLAKGDKKGKHHVTTVPEQKVYRQTVYSPFLSLTRYLRCPVCYEAKKTLRART